MASQPKAKDTADQRRQREAPRARSRGIIVHPNRSAIGPDEPGRNGHFRVVRPAPARPFPWIDPPAAERPGQ